MTQNFFFTYGFWKGYPFQNGWTVVRAPDRKIAVAVFRLYHPDSTPGIVNCADIYTEEQIKNTKMWENGNGGKFEREIISLIKYEIFD